MKSAKRQREKGASDTEESERAGAKKSKTQVSLRSLFHRLYVNEKHTLGAEILNFSVLFIRSSVGQTRPQSARGKVRERVRALMGAASMRSSVVILKTLTRTTGAPPQASPAPVTMRATRTRLPNSSSSFRASTLPSSSVNPAPQPPPRHHLHRQPQPPHCPHRSPRQRLPPLYLPSLCPRQARCLLSSQERRCTLKGFPLHIHL